MPTVGSASVGVGSAQEPPVAYHLQLTGSALVRAFVWGASRQWCRPMARRPGDDHFRHGMPFRARPADPTY